MKMHLGTAAFDDLLVTGATWLIGGCLAWAALIGVAAVVEALTGGRLRATRWVGCPRSMRRALLGALGLALASAPGSALASAQAPGPAERSLPVPARTSGASGSATGGAVVVRPGDSLWHLADARLPAAAPAGDVVDLVERLHHRNHGVIGPDPDLIRPGQRLVVPPVRHEQQTRQESP